MNFDKTTCWYRQDEIVSEMLRNYDVYQKLFPEMDHIKAFQKILQYIPHRSWIYDVGCGTAQISQLLKGHKYTGFDLSFIIEKCAKVKHPENNYFHFDVETDSLLNFPSYDVCLMNGFIDVMEYPLDVLEKIIFYYPNFVWIHRQEFSAQNKTHVIKQPSYGSQTYHSIINLDEFNKLIKEYNYEIVKVESCGFNNWENGGSSVLLKNKAAVL